MEIIEESDVISHKENLNYRKILDSDSSDEEIRDTRNDNEGKESKTPENSQEEEIEMETVVQPKKNRRKGLPQKRDIKPKEKPKQRKSALKAKDMIQEELKLKEKSEQQKIEREKEIRIPYHKPKQYSLKEFLARRTINKPSIEKLKEQQTHNNILSMKMSPDELEKFAQKMKAREEEAIQFFKSESESEDDENVNEDNKENSNVTELPPTEIMEVNQEPKVPEDEVKVDCNLKETVGEDEILINSKEPTDDEIVIIEEKDCKDQSDLVDQKIEVKKGPTLKTLKEMNDNKIVIDLETGIIQPKILTGPEMLFQKYLKTQAKPKHKETVSMNILSIENGKLENQRVEVKLDKEVELDHNRPGFSHERLKESLRNRIKHKRLEELKIKNVKIENYELEPEDKDEEINDCEDESNDVLKEDDDEEDEDEEEEEEFDDSELVSKDKKKSKSATCAFLDEEAINEDGDSDSEDDESDDSSEEEEEEESHAAAPKKGRIIKAFVDSDDENETEAKTASSPVMESTQLNEIVNPVTEKNSYQSNADLFKESEEIFNSDDLYNSQTTDFSFNEPSVSEEIGTNKLEALFDTAPTQVDDDDLMGLCSGQFASSLAPSSLALSSLAPSMLTNNDFKHSQNINENNEINTQESEFVSQVPVIENEDQIPPLEEASKVNKKDFLQSTDDEEENKVEERKKNKKRKKKKQKVKLGFSDDEDEDEETEDILNSKEDENESLVEEEEEEGGEEHEEETYLDYDSEENEIEVKMSKTDRMKVAKDYFEKEAELSESEWGSADEDEHGADKYDHDLADEEHFDQAQLREEVGRIHARKVMDQDLKDVKKIQDLLFEDEENDGIGRERKFRWKNQTEGFSLEDENARDAENAENAEADEENEIVWRRMRHERETLINEQSQKMTESDTLSQDILLLDQNSQTVTSTNSSSFVKRKFQIIKNSTTSFGLNGNSENGKMESPFLIKTNSKKFTNSFLSRDNTTLKKIASFISSKDDDVTNLSSHGGNSMSFAPIEKPEENKKRKSDNCEPREEVKRRKTENQLLDQLQ